MKRILLICSLLVVFCAKAATPFMNSNQVYQLITAYGGSSNAIANLNGTGTNTTLVNPTLLGLTSQQLTNRALFIGAGDSEQALYYAVGSTATMSPLNFPAWLPSMPTYAGRYDYVPMAIPGQSLVTISNNLESVYVPMVLAATNRQSFFFIQGGYNDRATGATEAQVSNTVWGISARMRAVGAKTVVFDIVNYATTAAALSNIVVNGGADYFVPFAGAESYLMADAIHLMPFGSKLWAQSLTNVLPLTTSPELARLFDSSSTNVTAPLFTAKGISASSFYLMPEPDSSNATNLTRPYIEAFPSGIWVWNTNVYRFGGWDQYFGKAYNKSFEFGVGQDAGGYPFASQTPGTNWVLGRLTGTGNGWGIVPSGGAGSGIVALGVDNNGNVLFRGSPIFYGTSSWTDSASNNVFQFGQGTGVATFAKSSSSWSGRILGNTNSWAVANNAGSTGLLVDGNDGSVTANGTLYSYISAPTNFSGSKVYLDSGGNGNAYSFLSFRTNGNTSATMIVNYADQTAGLAYDLVVNQLNPGSGINLSYGTNNASSWVFYTNRLKFPDGMFQTRALTNSFSAGSGINIANDGNGTLTLSATGGGGGATNAIGSTYTNNVLVGSGQTQIGFTNGTGTTVSAYTNGANRTIYRVDATAPVESVQTITTTNLVFSNATNSWWKYTLTNNTTFTFSGLAAGAKGTLELTGDGSVRTLAFPGVQWYGGVLTTNAASKRTLISFYSTGTTATNVASVYVAE